MAKPEIVAGSIVWAFAGTKTRPCVVVRVEGETLYVVPGFDKPYGAHVPVKNGTRISMRMGLEKDTHFNVINACRVEKSEVTFEGRSCPIEVLTELGRLLSA
jgi:hypothetical protein